MNFRRLGLILLPALLIPLAPVEAYGEDRLEIEVATEPGLSPSAPQQWARMLGKLDFNQVRLRGIRSGDTPNLSASQTTTGMRYHLQAILNRQGQLLLPGATFSRNDISKLRDYTERLQEEGLENFGAPRGRFDLTIGQLQTCLVDLSKPLSFSTQGRTTNDILNQLTKTLTLPLAIAPEAKTALAAHRPTEIELQGMTAGTGLAILLREEGLVLLPEKERHRPMQLKVTPYQANRPGWPVGWKPDSPPRTQLPKFYKQLTIEIDGYTLAETLSALQPRHEVTLQWDTWILHQKQIDPEKIQVTLPRKKTYLKRAVDRLLSQARLSGEFRVDEGSHYFYWITQFGRKSLRAEKP